MTGLEQDIGHRRLSDRKIEPAQRIKRLPPYLFGRLNALKLAKRQAEVDRAEKKLANPKFVENAPPAVVEKERAKLTGATAAVDELERQIQRLK